MPRLCSVCSHPERAEIEKALVTRFDSFRTIANRFGLSKAALIRHKAEHLPGHLLKAKELAEIASADDLLREMQSLQRRTLEILENAENQKVGLAAIAQARANIELMGELIGTLAHQPTIQVAVVELPALNNRRGANDGS